MDKSLFKQSSSLTLTPSIDCDFMTASVPSPRPSASLRTSLEEGGMAVSITELVIGERVEQIMNPTLRYIFSQI